MCSPAFSYLWPACFRHILLGMKTLIVWVLLCAAVAFAADVSGTWDASVTLDAGSGVATLVLKQDGDQVAGTYSGALGEAKVKGTVKGDSFELTFNHDEAGKISYSGVIKSPTKIEGSVDYGQLGKGTFTAQKK